MSCKSLFIVMICCVGAIRSQAAEIYIPVIDGDWWQVASTPDLGEYNNPKQEPVDFGLWQAADGNWQLWSCIRTTNLGGHTRLFYGWEGAALTDRDWAPQGIKMMAKPELGEPLGGLQAPHVVRFKEQYWMAYGDWDNMRLAVSRDGKTFERLTSAGVIFTEGPKVNNRDPMLLFTKGKWNCYYTAFPSERGYVYCRTSDDLLSWSDPVIVSYGGKAGNTPYSCECPHVVELKPDCYFLFRTQLYGPGAQTTIYQSGNPYHFGIDNDAYYVRQMNLCAPEIVTHEGKYYIAALNPDLNGVRIARLKWKCFEKPVFEFDDPQARRQWKMTGELKSGFTNSNQARVHPKTDFFINTGEGGSNKVDESLTGTMESPAFTITSAECLLYISGGKEFENLHISLRDAVTGDEYVRLTGNNHDLLDPVIVDSTVFVDKPVILKIVDNSVAGHLNFGGIYQASPAKDI
jgi:hypothetical protein